MRDAMARLLDRIRYRTRTTYVMGRDRYGDPVVVSKTVSKSRRRSILEWLDLGYTWRYVLLFLSVLLSAVGFIGQIACIVSGP